jgi:hypothetical protein
MFHFKFLVLHQVALLCACHFYPADNFILIHCCKSELKTSTLALSWTIVNQIFIHRGQSRLITAAMAVFRTDEQVFLKLVVNAETNKVLFAEAGKIC